MKLTACFGDLIAEGALVSFTVTYVTHITALRVMHS